MFQKMLKVIYILTDFWWLVCYERFDEFLKIGPIHMEIPSESPRGPNSCSIKKAFILQTQITLTIKILECPQQTLWWHHWRQPQCSSSSSLLKTHRQSIFTSWACIHNKEFISVWSWEARSIIGGRDRDGLATQNMFRVMWTYPRSNRINLFAPMRLIPHLLALLLNKKTNTLPWGSFNWSTSFCHFGIDVVPSRQKYLYPVQGMRGRKRLYLWVFSLAF